MKKTRKRYSWDFKAKVALEAIRGDLTLAELPAKHGIHHTMIAAWKGQAVDERGTEAIDNRARSPTPVDLGAVPPAVDQPVILLLCASTGNRRDAGVEAGYRCRVPGLSVVWQPPDGPASAPQWP